MDSNSRSDLVENDENPFPPPFNGPANLSAMNNGDGRRAQINVASETVQYREPPPPYWASPEQTGPGPTVIVQPALKSEPVSYCCPECRLRITTRVEYVNTQRTHMLAGFICGFTFWCMMCCLAALPYMLSTFKKTEHYCPNCNAFLGAYSKM